MSVVEDWRDRGRSLRGEYWRCGACGRFSAVRRAQCSHCHSRHAPVRTALPDALKAQGWSHSHLVIEVLDQSPQTAPVMLMELPHGQTMPFLLANSDRKHAAMLVGQTLRLSLRRMQSGGAAGPIVYGRKVAADAATRAAIMKSSDNAKRESGGQ